MIGYLFLSYFDLIGLLMATEKSSAQTSRLFLYVSAQLSSEVVNEIDMQEIKNWADLWKKLKIFL